MCITEGEKMKIFKMLVMSMAILFLLSGCGNGGSTEVDVSEYVEGIKVVDLLDETAYEKNGKEMVKALEAAVNASSEDFHKVYHRSKLIGSGTYFDENSGPTSKEYYYVGKMKGGKPTGYGVITNGKGKKMEILYIGKFDDGEVKDSYGVKLEYTPNLQFGTYASIQYEGIVAYLDKDSLYPIPADGNRILLYSFNEMYIYWDNKVFEIYEPKNLKPYEYDIKGATEFKVGKCSPLYIGGIENGDYSGNGKMYYEDGSLYRDGEFKRGEFVEGKTF